MVDGTAGDSYAGVRAIWDKAISHLHGYGICTIEPAVGERKSYPPCN